MTRIDTAHNDIEVLVTRRTREEFPFMVAPEVWSAETRGGLPDGDFVTLSAATREEAVMDMIATLRLMPCAEDRRVEFTYVGHVGTCSQCDALLSDREAHRTSSGGDAVCSSCA